MKSSKQAFMEALADRLHGLSKEERRKSLEFYSEMIGDHMEDGMVEEEAVAALGSMDDIVESVMYDMPLQTLLQAKVNDSRSKLPAGLQWTLLLVGLPLWLPLLLGGIAVILALYASVWAIVVALYAVLAALEVASVVGGVVLCFVKGLYIGLCAIGCGFVCAGLTVLAARLVPWLTMRLIALTKLALRKLKTLLIERKGE